MGRSLSESAGYDCYDTQAEEWYFTNINEPDVYQEICKKEQKI